MVSVIDYGALTSTSITMCPTHELLAEGVHMMELIHSERPSLPILDAIYFMTPTETAKMCTPP